MNAFYKYFWIFVIGSVVGWVVEVIFAFVRYRKFLNRSSLIYGPFGLAYGIGSVLLTMFLSNFNDNNILSIFIISFVIGSLAEYVMSWGMELVLGFVVWDYSKRPLNINGRICLLYSLYWGFLGVIWTRYIIGFLEDIVSLLAIYTGWKLLIIVLVFLVIDAFISYLAIIRSNKRLHHLGPQNKLEIFLDEHYDDEYLKKVFPQMFEYRKG